MWDKYFHAEAIHRIATNEPLTLKNLNFEDFNQEAIVYAGTRTKDQLIDELVLNRNNIVNDLQHITEEDYHQIYQDGEGHPFKVDEYIIDFAGHDGHHIRQIQQFLHQN